MSMITEQVKRLRSEAAGMILQNGTTARLLKEAANTIEQLAAKMRNENGFIFPENPTNGDMIGRSDMLDAIGHGTTYTSEELQRIIKALPSVNAQAKTGKWIKTGYIDKVTCSICNRTMWNFWEVNDFVYCPQCGARMVSDKA